MSNTAQRPLIQNPQLVGDPFIWEAGEVGILLIHGFTATTAEVQLLAKILHKNGYTISAPLLPGHYSSPEDLNRVRWQDWTSTVEAAYQELSNKCPLVFVGGESTGGLLALWLAAQHPEPKGILTYAPALRLTLSRFDIMRLYLLAPFVPYFPKNKSDRDLPWQGYYVNPLKGAIQLLKLQKVVYPLLPRIRQPLLIVQGRLDASVDASVPAIISSHVSSQTKEIHWMENSTHVVILDYELEQVGEITLQFITSVLNQPDDPHT